MVSLSSLLIIEHLQRLVCRLLLISSLPLKALQSGLQSHQSIQTALTVATKDLSTCICLTDEFASSLRVTSQQHSALLFLPEILFVSIHDTDPC